MGAWVAFAFLCKGQQQNSSIRSNISTRSTNAQRPRPRHLIRWLSQRMQPSSKPPTHRPVVWKAMAWTPMTGCEAVRQPCWTLVCQGQEHDIASLTDTKSRLLHCSQQQPILGYVPCLRCRAPALNLTTFPSLILSILTTLRSSLYLCDEAQQICTLASHI